MALVNGHLSLINELTDPLNTNSSEDLSSPETYHLLEEGSSCRAMNYPQSSDHHLLQMNFNGGYGDHLLSSTRSLLSFEQNDGSQPDNPYWETSMSYNYNNYWNQAHVPRNNNLHVVDEFNSCFENSRSFGSIISNEGRVQKDQYRSADWLYSEATTVTTAECSSKRPHTGESMQPLKKQCTGASTSRKTKAESSSSPPKDPQSLAAKNRRERISERLKILQELVPNGTKVDLVTMLEKAISYVKFLQLQVKVLATDEFWPVQGGKAPGISQVKEAIDAILTSQREQH